MDKTQSPRAVKTRKGQATRTKKLEVEIVYLPRPEWPRAIVDKMHESHVKWGTQNPKCPNCQKLALDSVKTPI